MTQQRMGRERHRVFVKSGVTADTTEELLERHFSAFGTVTDVYIPRALPGPTPKGFAYISFENDDAVLQAVKEAVHEIGGKHYPVGKAEPRPAERVTWHHEDRTAGPPARVAEPLLPWGGGSPRYGRALSPRGGILPAPLGGGGGGLARFDHMRPAMAQTPRLPPREAAPVGDMGPIFAVSRPALPFSDGYGPNGRAGPPGGLPLLPRGRLSRSPRIFVGGLPDALVERHIRAHFQKFGPVEDVYFPRERHTGKRRGFCFVRFDNPRAAQFAAARAPRIILGHEVGEIKVANERPEDFGGDEPVEAGLLDSDRRGLGTERVYAPQGGYAPDRGFGLERGGYGPERPSGYKLAPPPYYEVARDLPRELVRELPRELPRVDFALEFAPHPEIPADFRRDFPREFPVDFPRTMPWAFDGRQAIRYRPY